MNDEPKNNHLMVIPKISYPILGIFLSLERNMRASYRMYEVINERGDVLVLVAKNLRGELVYSVTLQKGKPVTNMICPVCQQRVIYRSGPKTIPHFAHLPAQSCTFSSEPESFAHLTGKLQLYQWLKQVEGDVVLEKYLPNIGQRPDVFLHAENRSYGVEFQCSSLSLMQFLKRTRGYRKAEIEPIWIFHHHFLKKVGRSCYKLPSFIQWGIRTSLQIKPLLVFYNPTHSTIFILYNLIPFSKDTWFADLASFHLTQCSWQGLFEIPKNKSSYFTEWRSKRMKMVSVDFRYKGLLDPFLNELYVNRLYPGPLPPIIGVPLSMGYMLRSPPVVWQAYVYMDITHLASGKSAVSKTDIQERFLERLRAKEIELAVLSTKSGCQPLETLHQYISLLVKANYLRENEKSEYIINKSLFPQSKVNTAEEVRIYSLLS